MTIYRAPPPGALAPAVVLDPFTLVYDRRSGQTHMLAEPAPEILDALARREADAATLLARLAERFEIDGDAQAAVSARLDELAALGLIEAR